MPKVLTRDKPRKLGYQVLKTRNQGSSDTQESAQTCPTDNSWIRDGWRPDEWNDGWSFEEWNDDWSSVGWHEGSHILSSFGNFFKISEVVLSLLIHLHFSAHITTFRNIFLLNWYFCGRVCVRELVCACLLVCVFDIMSLNFEFPDSLFFQKKKCVQKLLGYTHESRTPQGPQDNHTIDATRRFTLQTGSHVPCGEEAVGGSQHFTT